MIPLSVPNFCGNEQKYVDEALHEGWVSTGGAFITKFEQNIAAYLHVSEAAACQSGTAALHLSLICAGVQAGDEVIVPTLTFIAAVNPVRYVGAEPIFMDCDDTLCMDMDKLESFLRGECELRAGVLRNKANGKRISAVLVVHVFGNLADLDKLMALKQEFGFKVIEDATEALGSCYKAGAYAGKFAGTIGDMGAYSFNGNKIITTGGGGMIVSTDAEKTKYARYLSTQAKNDTLNFVHNEVGYNYRMTNLQAALGVAQLEMLENFIQIKERNYQAYQAYGIQLLPFRSDTRSNHWHYSYLSKDRDKLIDYLKTQDILSRPVWYLNHMQVPYRNNLAYQIEKAVTYREMIVNLPCSTGLTLYDAKFVAEKIHVSGF